MRAIPILLAAGIVAGTADAQAFTSPAGYLTTEGSSNHTYILFKYDRMRWQQLDDTNVGATPSLVQRIAWRRDAGAGANSTWTARTMDIEVVLSDSVPAAFVSTDFDANYAGMTSTVFTMKPVALPDWTQVPATTPAPFDLVLQLDTPWPHLGMKPFLWEVRTLNNTTGTDYGNDFQSKSGSRVTPNDGTSIGSSCTVGGQPMTLASTVYNLVTSFRISYRVSNAPPSTSVFANLDLARSNITFPGLCAPIVVAPTISFPLGQSDAVGNLQLNLGNIPFNQNAVGMRLYSQALALDPTQPALPFALSNGESNTVPNTPTGTLVPVTRLYEYALSSGSMRAPSAWTGGIVTRFD